MEKTQRVRSEQESKARFWIERLALKPHPEGGYYRESYRSSEGIPQQALPSRFGGARVFGTSIYFLLEERDFSAFHRIHQDEIWHFYDGDPLIVHVLDGLGHREILLGRNIEAGEQLQAVVPHGAWFASGVREGGAFALVGCTVAPGFEFDDFEMADRRALSASFPEHRSLIERFTRSRGERETV